MKKMLLSLLMVAILSTGLFAIALTVKIPSANAATKTWTVDDDGSADFHTIQEAVYASNSGDTIVVNSGNYSGNVEINKPLTLKGLSSTQRPIIFGDQTVSVVKITANDVKFSGFEVTNGGWDEPYGDAGTTGGISLFNVNTCNVTDNIVHDNMATGISLVNANYNSVSNNTCYSNNVGIRLWSWSPKTTNYNLINNNTLYSNRNTGIVLWSYVYKTSTVNYNNITDNLIVGIAGSTVSEGISIGKSYGNYIGGNTVTSNYFSLHLNSLYNTTFSHNNFLESWMEVYIFDDQESGPTRAVWDNGYPSGGNYWSNYNGTDSNNDGIGDIPYIINADNEDRYPLITPFVSNPASLPPIPTPTPQPTPTPTPIPTATPSPTPSTTPTPTPTPENTTNIQLSCYSSPSQSNFRVEIIGNLTRCNTGIQNQAILLQTSNDLGQSWTALTSVNTDTNGGFSATWLPSVTGNYLLRAIFVGTSEYPSANTTINCAVTSFNTESNFVVSSNSTLSALSFDSTTKTLSFSVSGINGTSGFVIVSIPKSLMANVSGFAVYLDGSELPYTVDSQQDSWCLSFSYHHSSHQVEIKMESQPNSQSNNLMLQITPEILAILGSIVLVLLVCVTAVYFAFRKQKTKQSSPE